MNQDRTPTNSILQDTLGSEAFGLAKKIYCELKDNNIILQGLKNDLIGDPGKEQDEVEAPTPAGLLPGIISILKSISSEITKQNANINSLRNNI